METGMREHQGMDGNQGDRSSAFRSAGWWMPALAAICWLLLLCPVQTLLHGGEVPQARNVLDDQLDLLRQMESSVSEYDWFAPEGDVRYQLVTKGDAYRLAYVPLETALGVPRKPAAKAAKAAKRLGGYITSWSPRQRQMLDTETGRMNLTRKPLKPRPDESSCSGREIPPLLFPFGFLAWKDRNPWTSERLQWGDLWNRPLITKRIRDLVKDGPAEEGGEAKVIIVEFKSIEVDDKGVPAPVARGASSKLVLRRHLEFGGAFLIDEDVVRMQGETPGARYRYDYQAVKAANGKVFPILQQITLTDGAEPPQVICKLRRAEVNGKVDQDDVEIDPTLAKTIFDLDTKMTIEPQ